MTYDEYLHYLDTHQHIEHTSDDTYYYYRNPNLPWYEADPNRKTSIKKTLMKELSVEDLHKAIHQGLDVVQFTRITGYMTHISRWNKGKRAELRDRVRFNINQSSTASTP